MNSKQLQLNMLGLAQRAGKLISGDELVRDAVKAGNIKLLVVASDTSSKTMASFERLSTDYGVPLVTHFTSLEISQAIGRGRKILGLTDVGMMKKFLSYDE